MSEETTKKTAEPVAEEDDEEDLEKLQKEIERMEAEAARITKETDDLEKKKEGGGDNANGDSNDNGGDAKAAGGVSTENRDGASVYVGQVDYSTTPEELLGHFEACGTVERVTIVCDKYTGKPKGFAYLEFQTEASVENAIKLDGSEFKGRNLKVTAKRVNVAGYHYNQQGAGGGGEEGGGRGGRGFGGRGGGYRGGGRGGRGFRGGYRGGYRGGRGGRGFRGRGYHHSYY
mmetsp:Transcript_4120/g.8507  ORF Transcript_4120/g.8507 Transcript_4120/m.8507 type:complete len:231 (+) Transcript_4120:173-865(+)|eukprot:CAMPEP_0168268134 /NCGR_PEP_ID=MMETSP0141_2-20121125/13521_1 /TAXON_ID=44445 /ORGANISM="Pseudo-nitzschia australis, Strain 10249 10 AB" /LENGTH=230 /DNA_ID=CAMNT_0008208471 /DNA_START=168 /DNA_END=860 /DNA_ORIENTATION=-